MRMIICVYRFYHANNALSIFWTYIQVTFLTAWAKSTCPLQLKRADTGWEFYF